MSGYFCQGSACHLGATQVAAGQDTSYAVLSDGTVLGWGDNTWGQLGTAGPLVINGGRSNLPIKIMGLGKAKAVAAAASTTCALLNDGTVWCWGSTAGGELGNGPIPDDAEANPCQ